MRLSQKPLYKTNFIHLIVGQGFSWMLHSWVLFKLQARILLSCISSRAVFLLLSLSSWCTMHASMLFLFTACRYAQQYGIWSISWRRRAGGKETLKPGTNHRSPPSAKLQSKPVPKFRHAAWTVYRQGLLGLSRDAWARSGPSWHILIKQQLSQY